MTEQPRIVSLCTGYGGLDDAVRRVFGGDLVAWSDVDDGPIRVMRHRAPDVPNLGSVKEINWHAQPPCEILTAGYPCQPFSNAGKRLGTDDPRHLWPWIAQGVGVLRPRVVVLENVASHLRRGFDVVSADLAGMGYRVAWGVARASDIGAPHQRRRLFIVALAEDTKCEPGNQWRITASGQAEIGRARPDTGGRGGVAFTQPQSQRQSAWRDGPARAEVEQSEPVVDRHATADALGVGRDERWPESAGVVGGSNAAIGSLQLERWGAYAPAVARWESIRGLRAPDPTVTGMRGGQVLSPHFVEWMMGLNPGHVTDVPCLTRNTMLKLLGNGVVPQQAEHAIRHLIGVLHTRV